MDEIDDIKGILRFGKRSDPILANRKLFDTLAALKSFKKRAPPSPLRYWSKSNHYYVDSSFLIGPSCSHPKWRTRCWRIYGAVAVTALRFKVDIVAVKTVICRAECCGSILSKCSTTYKSSTLTLTVIAIPERLREMKQSQVYNDEIFRVDMVGMIVRGVDCGICGRVRKKGLNVYWSRY